MCTSPGRGTLGAMGEYAVAWVESDAPNTIYAGGLSLDDGLVRLRGSDGAEQVVRELAPDELVSVHPVRRRERLGGFPSARVDVRRGGSLLVASLVGGGALWEVVDALSALLAG